jgi:aryl-alcohol dehydrogenase-like predicted oxidoreductase
MAEGLGLGVALWSPLGGGFLTGEYRRGEEGRLQRMGRLVHGETTEQKTKVLDTVLAVAEELGVAPGLVAIAWLRHRAARSTTSLIPLIGANNLAQLDSNLAALEVRLTDKQVERLDRVSAVPLGFSHEALGPFVYGLRIAAGKPELLAPRGAPVA